MNEADYVQHMLKRKAKALAKASGMNYTEALRYSRETEMAEPEIANKTWPEIAADIKAFCKFTNGE